MNRLLGFEKNVNPYFLKVIIIIIIIIMNRMSSGVFSSGTLKSNMAYFRSTTTWRSVFGHILS